jgi:hypothetical protein
MAHSLRGMYTTLTSTIKPALATLSPIATDSESNSQALLGYGQDAAPVLRIKDESTINGVVIGLLSSFGSAILIGFIFLIIYFFRYTSHGRILLDRMGRPGEYDDEQAFAREEAEALEEMDDLQRNEYLRAKGMYPASLKDGFMMGRCMPTAANCMGSVYPRKSARLVAHRHFIIPISSHPGKRSLGLGIRA